jgi:hypothetical protein
MIRKRLHRRWVQGNMALALWREVQRYQEDTWLDDQIDWLVRREDAGRNTWWVQVWARIICWATDWRTTWRLRP